MNVLVLVRHAKSSWRDAGLPDELRPLNNRGRRDAPVMARRLSKRGFVPDLIMTSPAVRALETAWVFAREFEYPADALLVDERLYGEGAAALLEIVRRLDDSHGAVMLFGHNPGMTELANTLGFDCANIPTCGVVEFEFAADTWAAVGDAMPTRVEFDYPKKLD